MTIIYRCPHGRILAEICLDCKRNHTGLFADKGDQMGDHMWSVSVKNMRDENRRALNRCKAALATLKNTTSTYADEHRKIIALRTEIDSVIEKHIDLAGTILAAPTE